MFERAFALYMVLSWFWVFWSSILSFMPFCIMFPRFSYLVLICLGSFHVCAFPTMVIIVSCLQCLSLSYPLCLSLPHPLCVSVMALSLFVSLLLSLCFVSSSCLQVTLCASFHLSCVLISPCNHLHAQSCLCPSEPAGEHCDCDFLMTPRWLDASVRVMSTRLCFIPLSRSANRIICSWKWPDLIVDF